MTQTTKEQQTAIDARERTVLVSAAAGSGKTKVLIDRIISLLGEEDEKGQARWHLNRMLLCTFTEAAAADMKRKLNERLLEEARAVSEANEATARRTEHYVRALDELDSTRVSTIHSFCMHVLKTEFQAADVDPQVRIMDERRQKATFAAAWREAQNRVLDGEHGPRAALFLASFRQDELL